MSLENVMEDLTLAIQDLADLMRDGAGTKRATKPVKTATPAETSDAKPTPAQKAAATRAAKKAAKLAEAAAVAITLPAEEEEDATLAMFGEPAVLGFEDFKAGVNALIQPLGNQAPALSQVLADRQYKLLTDVPEGERQTVLDNMTAVHDGILSQAAFED